MSDDTQTQLVVAAAAKVAEFSRLPAADRIKFMIDRGLIDRDGKLTTRCGGDADPEPGSSHK